MTLHSNMLPFFILSAVLCGVYLAYIFLKMRRSVAVGIGVGAVTGLVGPLIFMTPLDACTFEPEREPIDYWFGVVLFGLGAFVLALAVQWLARFFLAGDDAPKLIDDTTMGAFRASPLIPAILLTPTIIILVIFLYYPLIETFRLSTLLVRLGAPRTAPRCVTNFTSYLEPDGFSMSTLLLAIGVVATIAGYRFISNRLEGFEWAPILVGIGGIYLTGMIFNRIIEEDYRLVMFNTFVIATAIVAGGLILGLAIAYLAYQPIRGATIYRTLLIWPYAISPAISGIIFFVIFDPVSGIANHIIELFGGEGLEWIKDPWLARGTIIAASIWKTLGYNILFYIAGLQTVPTDLLEAAEIDGANPWQRFRNVVIPALSPITFFLIVTNLTYAFFNIFGTIDFLTRGGPVGATSVSIYEIVQLGIRQKDLGRAAAQSLVLFVLVIGVTWFQFRTSGRKVTYGA